ncbi:N-acetyltransferase family protein [Alkalihalobacterium sp. APHAB7]|uniref:GNAT family N-acetyltransferase n=1 Tax=Alkalihalobacterium sp. APHAB7 TaxID=3402081 RepID=UPI003AADCFA6
MNIRLAQFKDVQVIADIHVASWKTTYKGIVSEEYLDSLKVEDRQEMWKRVLSTENHPTTVLVIEEDDKVFGFAAVGKERTGNFPGIDGELFAIYLYENAQRKGGGKQLVGKAAEVLKDNGCQALVVWVLDDNPAKRFYEEALNGEFLVSEDIEIGGQSYKEAAYGWYSLDQLISR